MNDQTQKGLQLLRMYLKDASVECPNSPAIFGSSGETQFKIDMNVGTATLADDTYEVELMLQTKADMGDKTLFLIEIKYAAMFQARGFSEADIEHIVHIWAPSQIFPFARETVSQLSANAGFPQLLLPVVNFEQYYEARKAQKAEASPSIQ